MLKPEAITKKMKGLLIDSDTPFYRVPAKVANSIVSISTTGKYVTLEDFARSAILQAAARGSSEEGRTIDDLGESERQLVVLRRLKEETDSQSTLVISGLTITSCEAQKLVKEKSEIGVRIIDMHVRTIAFLEALAEEGKLQFE